MKYQAQLGKSIVEYDQETGIFVWIVCYRKPWKVGRNASHATSNGYLYISANNKQHSCSRLAYELVHGTCDKTLEIDHINRDKTDNRIANLRLCTRRENLANRAFAPNECGVFGVSVHRKTGLFRARFKHKTTYHRTLEDAAKGYAELALIAIRAKETTT